jgi:hypothetical protein
MVLFPLKNSNKPLFESLMPLAIIGTVLLFSILYFEKVTDHFFKEGLMLGTIWFLINILIDLPLFLLESPMQMSFSTYMSDIGITYLLIPIYTSSIGYLLQKKKEKEEKNANMQRL